MKTKNCQTYKLKLSREVNNY